MESPKLHLNKNWGGGGGGCGKNFKSLLLLNSTLMGKKITSFSCENSFQLTDAKKRADDSQIEVEELQTAKRKLDKEMEALQDRIEEMAAENHKIAKSKKKVQEEVCKSFFISVTEACMLKQL